MTRQRSGSEYPDWRWRSFPVFVAFVCGMLLAFIVNQGSMNPLAFVVQLLAIFGVGYSLIHLIVMNVVVAGRLRARRAARERGDIPDDELEDVVVYDEDTPEHRRSL